MQENGRNRSSNKVSFRDADKEVYHDVYKDTGRAGGVRIHNMVTTHFNEWFAMPEYAKASSLHVPESWHEAVGSEEAFVAATEMTGVPEH